MVRLFGDWKDHIDALLCHEFAHLLESVGVFDYLYKTNIQEHFGVNIKFSRNRKHHNKFWRKIYEYLKMNKNTIQVNDNYILLCMEK